jgi:hypothetical protein
MKWPQRQAPGNAADTQQHSLPVEHGMGCPCIANLTTIQKRGDLMKHTHKLILAIASVVLAASTFAQEGEPPAAARPVPRNAEGRVSFAGTVDNVGNWEGLLGTMANANGPNPANIPEALSLDQVPFQPWAKEEYAARRGGKDDPHTRCKPSGGARMFHTPYGLEILDIGEQVLFVNIGAPHSWREVHMDGRQHPATVEPGWYGHSVGHWEADTLVIDTIGFLGDGKFWFSRDGFPHTEQLHLIEKISRPSFDKLRYEVTVDDPGAYTATWTGGWFLNWADGNEPFDYLCQENNLDPERMVGEQ